MNNLESILMTFYWPLTIFGHSHSKSPKMLFNVDFSNVVSLIVPVNIITVVSYSIKWEENMK